MGIRDKVKPDKKSQVNEIILPEIDINNYIYDDVEPDEEISCINIGGKLVASLGNVITITGKPKSRKTTFLQAFLASFLSGETIFTITCEMPAKSNIALIDTEQSKFDLYRGIQRIKTMARIKKLPKNFKVFQNRPLQANENRQFLINLVQSDPDLKIIFIDGMLDFVADMNNIEESSSLLFLLQKLCFENNILIVTILHENKASNYTLGHIGSFLERKSQSLLRVEKNEYGSVLSSVYMRSDEDFAAVPIYYNYNLNSYELDTKFINVTGTAQQLKSNDLNKIAQNLFSDCNYMGYTEMINLLTIMFPKESNKFIKDVVKRLYNDNLIEKNDDKIRLKYF